MTAYPTEKMYILRPEQTERKRHFQEAAAKNVEKEIGKVKSACKKHGKAALFSKLG